MSEEVILRKPDPASVREDNARRLQEARDAADRAIAAVRATREDVLAAAQKVRDNAIKTGHLAHEEKALRIRSEKTEQLEEAEEIFKAAIDESRSARDESWERVKELFQQLIEAYKDYREQKSTHRRNVKTLTRQFNERNDEISDNARINSEINYEFFESVKKSAAHEFMTVSWKQDEDLSNAIQLKDDNLKTLVEEARQRLSDERAAARAYRMYMIQDSYTRKVNGVQNIFTAVSKAYDEGHAKPTGIPVPTALEKHVQKPTVK